MQEGIIGFFTWTFITAISFTALSTQATASQQETASYAISPPVVTTGTPVPGGNGPGMGRDYQRQMPGLGRGGTDYHRGYSRDPASVAQTPSLPPGQRYGRPGYGRAGRGYGYGYPGYRGQGGSGYPQHRQYGNPPRYPVTPGEQAAMGAAQQPGQAAAADKQNAETAQMRPAESG